MVNQSILIGEVNSQAGGYGVPTSRETLPFTLDGRFLRAFNGPGMGPLAQYANMRYNSGVLAGNPNVIAPGNPNVVGMDEDYDACDLENWFLAIQSADGKAIIPSFHRPGILQAADWSNTRRSTQPRPVSVADPPPSAGGRPRPGFVPQPDPTQTDGTIKYDVDNDADGITDSVWVDLGYPPIHDSRGLLYKPMFAFMVLGLNGRIPLNTAGNLNLRNEQGLPHYMHASHLGYSPSEVDPTFGLQNSPYLAGALNPSSQLDNAQSLDSNGNTILSPISVNVTQLRNILAGTRTDPNGQYADNNFVLGLC